MNKIILIILFSFTSFASTDEDLAININRIFINIKKGRVKKSLIKKSLPKIKRSKTFNIYYDDLRFLQSLSSNKYLKKTTCELEDNSKHQLHSRFKSHIVRYCHQVKFNRLTNLNSFKKTDINESFHYLIKNSPRELGRLLQSKVRTRSYNTLKKQLTQITIDNNLEISPHLIQHYEDNKFVDSTKVYLPDKLKLKLHRELKTYYRDFKESLKTDSKKDYIQKSEFLLSFYDRNKKNFRAISFKYLLYTGLQLLRRNHKDESLRFFKYTYNIESNFSKKEEALFYILWNHIKYDRYDLASKEIDEYKVIESFSKHNSKIKYWTAYTLFKENEDSIARHLFNLLIKNDPLSYYAIISKFTYPELVEENHPSKDKTLSPIEVNKSNFNNQFVRNISEVSIWSSLKLYHYSNRILRTVSNTNSQTVFANENFIKDFSQKELNKILSLSLIKNFKNKKDFLSSFRLLNTYLDRDTLKLSDVDLNYIFPKKYLDIINKHNNGLDPLLILSLIRQESAFNQSIRSHANAMGLMQLLPQTARTMGKLRHNSDLYKPNINIKYGIKYLKKLIKKFDNNLIFALGAYNAGPSKIKQWQKNTFSQVDPIKLIEEIPYKETRMYVKLIYRNMYFYKLLNKQKFDFMNYKSTFLVSMVEETESRSTR